MPSDAQKIQKLKLLVDSGFSDRLLISQDNVCKHELVRYGGHGYAHILENIVPKMEDRGISRATVMKILTENPRKWLTFVWLCRNLITWLVHFLLLVCYSLLLVCLKNNSKLETKTKMHFSIA